MFSCFILYAICQTPSLRFCWFPQLLTVSVGPPEVLGVTKVLRPCGPRLLGEKAAFTKGIPTLVALCYPRQLKGHVMPKPCRASLPLELFRWDFFGKAMLHISFPDEGFCCLVLGPVDKFWVTSVSKAAIMQRRTPLDDAGMQIFSDIRLHRPF